MTLLFWNQENHESRAEQQPGNASVKTAAYRVVLLGFFSVTVSGLFCRVTAETQGFEELLLARLTYRIKLYVSTERKGEAKGHSLIIHTQIILFRVTGGRSLSQLTRDKRRGTPWTGRLSITGPTLRQTRYKDFINMLVRRDNVWWNLADFSWIPLDVVSNNGLGTKARLAYIAEGNHFSDHKTVLWIIFCISGCVCVEEMVCPLAGEASYFFSCFQMLG